MHKFSHISTTICTQAHTAKCTSHRNVFVQSLCIQFISHVAIALVDAQLIRSTEKSSCHVDSIKNCLRFFYSTLIFYASPLFHYFSVQTYIWTYMYISDVAQTTLIQYITSYLSELQFFLCLCQDVASFVALVCYLSLASCLLELLFIYCTYTRMYMHISVQHMQRVRSE